MKKNFSCIIFSGLDGSGKSTQANLLKDFFQEHGISKNYFWLRSPIRISIPLIVIFK